VNLGIDAGIFTAAITVRKVQPSRSSATSLLFAESRYCQDNLSPAIELPIHEEVKNNT
jgi:hypothetical protein